MSTNRFGKQLSVRLTPTDHQIINANFELITGSAQDVSQKEFFSALLRRATLSPSDQAAHGDSVFVKRLYELEPQLKQLQEENEALKAEIQRLSEENKGRVINLPAPENAILVHFEPADLYFIDKLIDSAKKRFPSAEIDREIYTRAMMRGLYEEGSIHAHKTFSTGEIDRIRKHYEEQEGAANG